MIKSIKDKIGAWIRLTRAEHSILSATGVLVAIIIALRAGGAIDSYALLYALVVPIFINLGAFALNDYFDIEADRENGLEKRPLVNGEIKPNYAAALGIVGLVSGGLFGFLINFEAGVISVLFAIISFLYNWKLKDIAFLGNLFISISMGISFIFGAVVCGFSFGLIPLDFWILGVGATAAGLGREIVKSVQDVEGDKKARGSRTLPVLIGERNSLYMAAITFVLFTKCVAWLVIFSRILKFNILSLGLLVLGAFAYLTFAYLCAFTTMDEKRIESVRKLTLQVLGICMIAILISLI